MAGQMTLVLASGNPGKLRELQSMLQPLGWQVHAHLVRLKAEGKVTGSSAKGAWAAA